MRAIRSTARGKAIQKREPDETEKLLNQLADDAAEGYRTFLYALSRLVLDMPHLEQSTISPDRPQPARHPPTPSPTKKKPRTGRGGGKGYF
jgi:hypothetical protein